MRDFMKFTSLSLTCGLLKLESACFSIASLSENWLVNTMLSNKPEIRSDPPIVTWWALTWKVLWDPFPALACVSLPSRNNDESEAHLFESPYPLLSSRHYSHMIDPVGPVKFLHFIECFFDGSPRWILFNSGSTESYQRGCTDEISRLPVIVVCTNAQYVSSTLVEINRTIKFWDVHLGGVYIIVPWFSDNGTKSELQFYWLTLSDDLVSFTEDIIQINGNYSVWWTRRCRYVEFVQHLMFTLFTDIVWLEGRSTNRSCCTGTLYGFEIESCEHDGCWCQSISVRLLLFVIEAHNRMP